MALRHRRRSGGQELGNVLSAFSAERFVSVCQCRVWNNSFQDGILITTIITVIRYKIKIKNKIRIVLRCEIQYMNIHIAKSGGKDEKVVKRSKADRVNLFTK